MHVSEALALPPGYQYIFREGVEPQWRRNGLARSSTVQNVVVCRKDARAARLVFFLFLFFHLICFIFARLLSFPPSHGRSSDPGAHSRLSPPLSTTGVNALGLCRWSTSARFGLVGSHPIHIPCPLDRTNPLLRTAVAICLKCTQCRDRRKSD